MWAWVWCLLFNFINWKFSTFKFSLTFIQNLCELNFIPSRIFFILSLHKNGCRGVFRNSNHQLAQFNAWLSSLAGVCTRWFFRELSNLRGTAHELWISIRINWVIVFAFGRHFAIAVAMDDASLAIMRQMIDTTVAGKCLNLLDDVVHKLNKHSPDKDVVLSMFHVLEPFEKHDSDITAVGDQFNFTSHVLVENQIRS